MSETFEVNGEEYSVDGNPTLGTVREVEQMQTSLILNYLDEEALMNMDDLDDETALIQRVIDEKGFDTFKDMKWERSMLAPRQTISLACDNPFDAGDFDDVPADTFIGLKEASQEALGGDASDFFEELGIGTFLNEEEMQRRAQQAMENEES